MLVGNWGSFNVRVILEICGVERLCSVVRMIRLFLSFGEIREKRS